MTAPLTSPETSVTELLQNAHDSVLQMQVTELRRVLMQAIKTLEYHKMDPYVSIGMQLTDLLAWCEKHITKAQCLVIYHMYLMFYKNDSCPECQEFLKKLLRRYQSAQ